MFWSVSIFETFQKPENHTHPMSSCIIAMRRSTTVISWWSVEDINFFNCNLFPSVNKILRLFNSNFNQSQFSHNYSLGSQRTQTQLLTCNRLSIWSLGWIWFDVKWLLNPKCLSLEVRSKMSCIFLILDFSTLITKHLF